MSKAFSKAANVRLAAIDEILENFDFCGVRRAMHAAKWKWHDVGIPSIDDLRVTAYQLLLECPFNGSLETGGFKASYEHGYLTLEFVYRRASASIRRAGK